MTQPSLLETGVSPCSCEPHSTTSNIVKYSRMFLVSPPSNLALVTPPLFILEQEKSRIADRSHRQLATHMHAEVSQRLQQVPDEKTRLQ
jgi:hypothetical protein